MPDIVEVMPFLVIAVLLGFSYISNALTLSDRIALGGWSPIDWVNHLAYPENFLHDFPSGIEIYRSSLFMHFYPIGFDWFGLLPEIMIYGVMLIEIVFLASAGYYLPKTLLPKCNAVVPAIVASMMVASSIGMIDLSRIAIEPFFAGLYYNIAYASYLFAIAFMLQGHWWLASGSLFVSVATHPIMGGLGAIFIGVCLIARPQLLRHHQIWLSFLVVVLLAGGWLIVNIMESPGLVSGGVPREEWLSWSTAMSVHWYPVAFGSLREFHGHHLLPLLGFVALFFRYLRVLRLDVGVERAWRWGVVVMLLLVVAGVVFSTWTQPFLIKLNLQRACVVILFVGLPVVISGLVDHLLRGALLTRVAAALLLVSPFLSRAVLPIVAVMIISLPYAYDILRRWHVADGPERGACSILMLVTMVILGYMFFSGYLHENLVYYIGTAIAWKVSVLIVILILMANRFTGYQYSNLVILLAAGLSALYWVSEDYLKASADHEKAVAYRQVQDWARSNTQKQSV
ncbi:MAG: hypothetical protein N3D16_12280, partial [Anaerolineales bacterium]|nr:hypothetical protein [Anaerolineales bacterium]